VSGQIHALGEELLLSIEFDAEWASEPLLPLLRIGPHLLIHPACSHITVLVEQHCLSLSKGKVHPCTGTEALYMPYSPTGE